MTKFIDTTKEKKKGKETVFTHVLSRSEGWELTMVTPSGLKEVKYLGYCEVDGDVFAAINKYSYIEIFKGVKGDEFE